MVSASRIDELRRRVAADPTSIVFAQLAEELRREGHFDEAVRVARAGLDVHPGYVSARVTLGRALAALGRDGEAKAEFERVLRTAPDNLLALRSMADLHQRLDAAADVVPPTPGPAAAADAPPEQSARAGAADPRIRELEAWLAAILADRHERARHR